MIKVENVTKDYTVGQTVIHALRGVTLAIEKGEFLSIAGPSGSGKTTLLNLMFQSFNLIPVLSAYENVSFALSLLGINGTEIKERTYGILEEVGLKGMETRLPGELSGGQQQRVAVARALIKEPDMVLADEPTANLDSDTGHEILDLMVALNQKHGTTFVFSTHDQMVMDYARRLVRLHDGQVTSDERRGS
jgi:putative ABC transport system ATP-binding protein